MPWWPSNSLATLKPAAITADAGRWYLTAAERFRRADWKTKAKKAPRAWAPPNPRKFLRLLRSAKSEEPTAAETWRSCRRSAEPQPANRRTNWPTPAALSTHAPETPSSDPLRAGNGAAVVAAGAIAITRAVERATLGASQRDPLQPAAHCRPTPEPQRTSRAFRRLLERVPEACRARPSSARPLWRSRARLAAYATGNELSPSAGLSPADSSDAADKAPAGPGVWVLTDSDLTTYYYVEACQTLRVAIPNLLRGGAARRGGESIRPRLAEHLGIPEARVAKYLARPLCGALAANGRGCRTLRAFPDRRAPSRSQRVICHSPCQTRNLPAAAVLTVTPFCFLHLRPFTGSLAPFNLPFFTVHRILLA